MKKLFFIVIVFIIIAIATFFVSRQSIKQPEETGNQVSYPSVSSFSSLSPSVSTEEDVIKSFGNPQNIVYTTEGSTYQYETTIPNIFNEVAIENRTVSFIKEPLTTVESLSVKLKDFPSAIRLYTPDSNNDVFFFAELDKGIGFLGNTQNDTLFEVWHFKPEPLSSFLTRPFAEELSVQPRGYDRF